MTDPREQRRAQQRDAMPFASAEWDGWLDVLDGLKPAYFRAEENGRVVEYPTRREHGTEKA